MTHVTCRLTAKNRDQLRNPTLGSKYTNLYKYSYLLTYSLTPPQQWGRTSLVVSVVAENHRCASVRTVATIWPHAAEVHVHMQWFMAGRLRSLARAYFMAPRRVWSSSDAKPSPESADSLDVDDNICCRVSHTHTHTHTHTTVAPFTTTTQDSIVECSS